MNNIHSPSRKPFHILFHLHMLLPHHQGHLYRCPTPYPKEMREKARHMRNLAMRQSLGDGAQASGWSPHADNSIRIQQEVDKTGTFGPSNPVIVVCLNLN